MNQGIEIKYIPRGEEDLRQNINENKDHRNISLNQVCPEFLQQLYSASKFYIYVGGNSFKFPNKIILW